MQETSETWHAKPQAMDFFDFKGEIEEVLAAGRVQVDYVRSERSWLHPGQSAEILVDGQSDWLLWSITSIFRR